MIKPGQRVGALVVVAVAPPKRMPNGKTVGMLYLRCACGARIIRSRDDVRRGRVQSCGHDQKKA